VEILVVEVGMTPAEDQLFRITFDGVVLDEDHFSVIGGEAEPIADRLKESWREGLSLGDALRTARSALAGADRTIEPHALEVAILSRVDGRRAFRRIDADDLSELLGP